MWHGVQEENISKRRGKYGGDKGRIVGSIDDSEGQVRCERKGPNTRERGLVEIEASNTTVFSLT